MNSFVDVVVVVVIACMGVSNAWVPVVLVTLKHVFCLCLDSRA